MSRANGHKWKCKCPECEAADQERLRIAAQAALDDAIAAGRLPAEVPPEAMGRIAQILRQHYAEQIQPAKRSRKVGRR